MAMLATPLESGSTTYPRNAVVEPVDVNGALAGLEPAFALMGAGGIRVELDLGACNPVTGIGREAFARVISDAIGRMRSDMSGGGRLEVRTTDGPPGFVEIELSDAAAAWSAQAVEDMFGPADQTAAEPRSPGLSRAFRLVHDAGGTIVCETGPGFGRTLRVLLPLQN